jgi:NAD(P)-dependent dehydrogenase (short-subunit alcohol dehydrogenase family)
MGKLDGKVAIVNGAARGLGRAYAKRLAGLGAMIAVADLNLRSYGGIAGRGEEHDRRQHGRRDRGVGWYRHRH